MIRPQVHDQHFHQFRCIADRCPDTCCAGWQVNVDKSTYEKYQTCSDPLLGNKLKEFVTINELTRTDEAHAVFQTVNSRCVFLSDQLCGIQTRLGEEYLGKVCDTFPRVNKSVNGLVEGSLDLSCPEAARIALLDPEPIRFFHTEHGASRLHHFSSAPRNFIPAVLQNRRHTVAQRMILVALVCDKLDEVAKNESRETVADVLEGFRLAIDHDLFKEHLRESEIERTELARIGLSRTEPGLKLVLELLVSRVNLDFVSPRFMDLYRNFAEGLEIQASSTTTEISLRYQSAYENYYAPLMRQHEHIMEHYLVNYAYKTSFPNGTHALNQYLRSRTELNPIAAQYLLMAAHYSVIVAASVGLSAFYKSAFGLNHVVDVIQTCSKTLEHCTTYPARVLDILIRKGIRNASGMAALTRN